MKAILYRCSESKHRALFALAKSGQLSVQKLLDQFATSALAERRAGYRFHALQRTGNPATGRKPLAQTQRRLAPESE